MHTQRDDGHFLHYDLHNVVPTVEKGEGIYLYDGNGKKYIDGSSGPVVVNIGHGVKEIGESYAAQSDKVAYVFWSHFTSKPVEELAGRIAELAPGNLDRVFLYPADRKPRKWQPRSPANIILNWERNEKS